MSQLLMAGVLSVVATYFATHKDAPTLHQDQLFQVKQEVRAVEEKAHAEEAKQGSFRAHGNHRGGAYVEQRRTTREKHVRHVLETLFRYRFPSVKPDWLRNPKTGRKLEIDCFCKEMRVGVEIDGEQHHRYIPYFHRTYQGYLDMRERDLVKKRGIKLVRLPFHVPDADIEAYLLRNIGRVR
jgi:very-short-patch-repair endonuclease